MGEDFLTGGDFLQLRLAVLEGCQIVVGAVYRLAGANAQHGIVFVGPEEGDDNGGQGDDDDQNQADEGHLVFDQPLHAVLKEGGRGPHLDHVCFFFLSSRNELIQIHVHTKRFCFLFHLGEPP